jgi:hypothetical protein
VGDALARMRGTGRGRAEDEGQAPLAKGNLADDRWASSEASLDGVPREALPFAASFSHPAAHKPIPRQALARIFPSPSRRATSFCTSANLAACAVSGRAPSSAAGVVIPPRLPVRSHGAVTHRNPLAALMHSASLRFVTGGLLRAAAASNIRRLAITDCLIRRPRDVKTARPTSPSERVFTVDRR